MPPCRGLANLIIVRDPTRYSRALGHHSRNMLTVTLICILQKSGIPYFYAFSVFYFLNINNEHLVVECRFHHCLGCRLYI
ncbi:MAG: hypothetical protein ACI9HB_000736 [Gammaproteobacteria bacterium]|jgi:hypothetical protein